MHEVGSRGWGQISIFYFRNVSRKSRSDPVLVGLDFGPAVESEPPELHRDRTGVVLHARVDEHESLARLDDVRWNRWHTC